MTSCPGPGAEKGGAVADIRCAVVRVERVNGTSRAGCFHRLRPVARRREFLECGHNVLTLASAPEARARKCRKCTLCGAKQVPAGHP